MPDVLSVFIGKGSKARGGRVVHRFGGGSARQAAEAMVNSGFYPQIHRKIQ